MASVAAPPRRGLLLGLGRGGLAVWASWDASLQRGPWPFFPGGEGFLEPALPLVCPQSWRRVSLALVPATPGLSGLWENGPEGPSLLMRAAEMRGTQESPGAPGKPFLTLSSAGWESKVVWDDKRCFIIFLI